MHRQDTKTANTRGIDLDPPASKVRGNCERYRKIRTLFSYTDSAHSLGQIRYLERHQPNLELLSRFERTHQLRYTLCHCYCSCYTLGITSQCDLISGSLS